MSVKQIFNTSAELDYPTVLPTLDLDFANSKTLDPRITFTRASGGSYTDVNGLIKYAGVNEPRFDHDPVTGESLGFLVEEARTNSFLYSEQLDNAAWRKFDITATANAGLAPDGTTTAELITTASTTAQKYFDQFPQPVLQTSSNYCVSFFVKLISGTGNATSVSISSANGAISPVYASYALRLDNFAESTEGNLPSVRGYTIFPNGWVRMYMVFNTSTQTNADIQFRFGTNDTVSSYHVWGYQFEQGSFPTSYIPTVASTRTRAADAASITGKNFSSWFNPSVGTFFTDSTNDNLTSNIARSAYDTANTVAFSLGSGAGRVYTPILGYLSNNTIICNLFSYNGGGTEFGPNLQNTLSNTADVSRVCVYTDIVNNLYAISTAGQINVIGRPLDVSRTGQLAYTLAQSMVIGYNSNYYGNYIGRIKRITYYPKRLTNQQLQALTT